MREGVVVFLGTLARHLPPEDPKRSAIVQTLLDVLGTPSESVQRSVSTCLAPLIQVWTWVWGECELPGGVLDKNVRCMRSGGNDAVNACLGAVECHLIPHLIPMHAGVL